MPSLARPGETGDLVSWLDVRFKGPFLLLAVFAVPAVFAVLALSAGCLDVADGRARRDAMVGQASGEGLVVAVDDGLAAVRGLTSGRVHLWASAPRIVLAITVPPGAGGLSLLVENTLADATLSPLEGAPAPASVARAVPTEKEWRLAPPPGGGRLRFVLGPADWDDRAPWRFAVYADVQEKIDEVQDLYGRMSQDPRLRFAVLSGDLTRRGSRAELERFQREMKTLAFPVFATLGNHELGTREDLFHEHLGRGNASFVFRGVRFTLLDSASATIAPAVYGWLEGWLESGRDGPHAVFMHIPPLDPAGVRNGAFASRAEANKLLALLAGGGVDVTIYGHVHSFYAYSNAGIPAYITGGGGAIPERLDGIGRHYLAVDVEADGRFLTPAVVRVD
jgi:3',5'-cyclic-AMP phosphodiesterase